MLRSNKAYLLDFHCEESVSGLGNRRLATNAESALKSSFGLEEKLVDAAALDTIATPRLGFHRVLGRQVGELRTQSLFVCAVEKDVAQGS
jgi:hypothetical protein